MPSNSTLQAGVGSRCEMLLAQPEHLPVAWRVVMGGWVIVYATGTGEESWDVGSNFETSGPTSCIKSRCGFITVPIGAGVSRSFVFKTAMHRERLNRAWLDVL